MGLTYNVKIPEKVKIEINNYVITVSGEKCSISRQIEPEKLEIKKGEKQVDITPLTTKRKNIAYAGTIAAHLKNMIDGVTNGYTYKLKILYAHFPINVSIEGDKIFIKNFGGEKKPRIARLIGKTKVEIKGQDITVTGANKEEVGQTAANIEQTARVKGKDIRRFPDGIYITQKG